MLENKIPPPAIGFLTAILMWGLSKIPPYFHLDQTFSIIAVFALLVSAISFVAAAVISFREAQTTVNPLNPEAASSMVLVGVYRVSRNPMYVGLALVLCAWAIYLASFLAILGLPIFVLFIHRFQILPEEKALEKLFGEQFLDYKSKVRRWL